MPSSVLTKKVFADTLKKLMQTKPFEKISISDITSECGMNRNSFYYHFPDKYELLNWVFVTEIGKRINAESDIEQSAEERLLTVCEYFYENRIFYANAFSYEGQNSFNEYFRDILRTLISVRMDSDIEIDIEDDLKEFMSEFFIDAIVTSLSKWVKGGCKTSPERFTEMLKLTVTGTAKYILDKVE